MGWEELDRLSGPTDFTVSEVPERVLGWSAGAAADPWAQYGKVKQRLPASLTAASRANVFDNGRYRGRCLEP